MFLAQRVSVSFVGVGLHFAVAIPRILFIRSVFWAAPRSARRPRPAGVSPSWASVAIGEGAQHGWRAASRSFAASPLFAT